MEKFIICLLFISAFSVESSQTLIFDEQKGIIFVDQEEAPDTKKLPPPTLPERREERERRLILGREADSPEAYFKTGLKFFDSGDFYAAQKNFSHANSVDPSPEYMLWMGKCYRQTGQHDEMLRIMRKILENHRTSDVAPDALFEIAFYYQTKGDYYMATRKYNQLAEQYPYAESFSGEHSFLRIAREQTRNMRAEIIDYLGDLGVQGESFRSAIKKFQKENGLALTGKPDQITVEKIKEKHNTYISEKQKRVDQQEAAKRYIYHIMGAGVLAILNILFMIYMRVPIKEKKAHLDIMEQMVSDMNKEA